MATVAVTLAVSYTIGRALGLNVKLAILVACGNSICGNSAIATVAPIIGADGQDIAASISFTAVLGVLMVLGLPLLDGDVVELLTVGERLLALGDDALSLGLELGNLGLVHRVLLGRLLSLQSLNEPLREGFDLVVDLAEHRICLLHPITR